MTYQITLKSQTETQQLARNFAKSCSGSEVIALTGQLGAGKTFFMRHFAEHLGYENAHSPTFSLMNEFSGGIHPLIHMDLYRVKVVEELFELDWDNLLERQGVFVAEWANLFPELFPEDTIWIKIEHLSENERLVTSSISLSQFIDYDQSSDASPHNKDI